ncbi:hypothetical protein AMELA_G00067250 [Ameiurus melas]|uniref:Sushi domain-containing protein n=1 Tax=Ameiurus melas TaxID=219545 RepID=A0A7J6B714_AMEME|nr:hypothetical protein AMELA_G00067250 [Ameiurus melas]
MNNNTGFKCKTQGSGSYVSFQCDAGYQFVGAYYARCVNGNWDLPVCKSRDETVCSAPRVPNAQPAVDLAQFYANGRSVRFECDSGYEFEGTDTAWCVEGIWRLPECKRRGPHGGSVRPDPDVVPMPGGNCDTQPLIENGDVTELPAPCKLDRTKIHTSHPDEYLQEGETKRFHCGQLWKIDIICIKGTAVYGECKYHYGAVMGQSSCTAPVVPNAKPKNELAASYPTGSFLGYVCDSGYEFVDTRYALCEDGTWNLPVCKLQTSCTVPFVPNAELAEEFTAALYPTGSSVRFVCDRGSEFEGTKYAVCEDGTWKLPLCKSKRPPYKHD